MALQVGTAGTVGPPIDGVLKNALRSEQKGYDAIWWPDHWMAWHPESVWVPDITPLAGFQKSPHVFLDPIAVIAAVGARTERVRLGTAVTEPVRRHPSLLAHEWLSLHHVTKGRAILGVGAGEGENILPYGIDFSRPVAKFEEALTIVRLLWENDEPLDFEGDFWTLRRAVCGMGGYEGAFPPIWTGAHGPRMLAATGRLADGWLPAYASSPKAYGESLGVIRESARAAGRDPAAIEAGLFQYTVVANDHDECHRILGERIPKGFHLALPDQIYEERGYTHPLGAGFSGLKEYIPTHFSRDEALKAIDAIPDEVAHDVTLHGTPDEIVARLREFEAEGLQHILIMNMTWMGDLSKLRESFHLQDEVLRALKA